MIFKNISHNLTACVYIKYLFICLSIIVILNPDILYTERYVTSYICLDGVNQNISTNKDTVITSIQMYTKFHILSII